MAISIQSFLSESAFGDDPKAGQLIPRLPSISLALVSRPKILSVDDEILCEADLSNRCTLKYSLFFRICRAGQIEKIRDLIHRFGDKCNPEQRVMRGSSMLYLIENLDVIKILCTSFGVKLGPSLINSYGHTLLMACIFNKDFEKMKYLVNFFNLNMRPDCVSPGTRKTALIYACEKNLTEFALLLLQKYGKRCKLDTTDFKFKRAIDYAMDHENYEIIECLKCISERKLPNLSEYALPVPWEG